MQKCGFCSMLSGLLRRAMCVSSRRDSESYYRELGDQDTLKIEDRSSEISEQSDEPNDICQQEHLLDIAAELSSMTDRNACTGRFLTMHKRRKKRLLTRSLCQEVALLDDLQMGLVQCILDQAMHWNFNAFALENVSGGRCVPALCIHLFHVYGLLTHFKLDVSKAWKLFSLIEEGYHSTNPYHTTVHAADVTQAMHCFLQQEKIRCHMEPLEVLASLIAAIAHDVDHPGVNQPFLIATSNHLAALYRNTSVLENHHWRLATSCLIESGLLDQLGEAQEQVAHQISSLILATDITRQQEYLSQFKLHLDKNTLDMRKSEHRHLVLQIALKCADISNPCRPWEISRKWSLKVCEEFFRQGDYERKLNLPVTALCDRHTTSIPKIQIGFLNFVVSPLCSEWHRFLKTDLTAQMKKNLQYNMNKWEMLAAQEMAEETRTELSDAELVEEEHDTGSGTNFSDSSELLLPLRRGSLAPAIKQSVFKDQLRRLSVPLNIFQDSKMRNRDRSLCSSITEGEQVCGGVMAGSGHSLHSQLSLCGQCEAAHDADKALSSEKLLPDSSIASLTTPRQATRLSSVLRNGASSKLVRQQTFPPLEQYAAAHALQVARSHHLSQDDSIYASRRSKTDYGQNTTEALTWENKFTNIFKRNIEKTDNDDASENNNVENNNETRKLEKENLDPLTKSSIGGSRRESAPVGSQLRENLMAAPPAALAADALFARRKSMPTDTLTLSAKEKKFREVSAGLPSLFRRKLSLKEACCARRGSAPVPVAASELRGLASLGALRHSVNGNRRKPGAAVTSALHQWLNKSSFERTMQAPRRSSLPVEVLSGDIPY